MKHQDMVTAEDVINHPWQEEQGEEAEEDEVVELEQAYDPADDIGYSKPLNKKANPNSRKERQQPDRQEQDQRRQRQELQQEHGAPWGGGRGSEGMRTASGRNLNASIKDSPLSKTKAGELLPELVSAV